MKRVLFSTLIIFAFFVSPVFASSSNGTIDATSKYAWGENTGWLNFGTTGGNIHVTDTALTGYIWSGNYGWINLAPAGSGVTNNSEGTLSGSAWGENLGYISFSGVTINSSGVFSGTASGTVAGRIRFDCTNCSVVTDWRPASTRGSGTTQTIIVAGGSGGGYVANPDSGFSINNDAPFTFAPMVTLSFILPPETNTISISNYEDFRDAVTKPRTTSTLWSLCSNTIAVGQDCVSGIYTIYARFYSTSNALLGSRRSSITYTHDLLTRDIQERPRTVLEQATRTVKDLLARIFGLPPSAIPGLPPGTIAVQPIPKAPLALQHLWDILPQKAIGRFVLVPLSHDVATIAQKFPEIQKIFRDMGVARATDLSKLQSISLSTPGLTKSSGIIPPSLVGIRTAPIPGIPLGDLPRIAKERLPTEIVFARNENERIDFDLKLRLNNQGILEKRVETIVGKKLKLAVKIEGGAKSVKGYLVFRSRSTNALQGVPTTQAEGITLKNALASALFALPVLGEPAKPATYIPISSVDIASLPESIPQNQPIEQRLALLEFEYTDPDHDGIYTAEIAAPRVAGEYDIITIIHYTDPDRGNREIRLTAVVDPEGYVYEQLGGKEVRIPGAVVSLYALDQATKTYRLWSAEEYAQENPQVTDNRGTYAFLVPEGTYYIQIDTPQYELYRGVPFTIQGNNEVHTNIELRQKYWFLHVTDWKTLLLIIALLMLFYHFYEDRKRQRLETALLQSLSSEHDHDILHKGPENH